MTFNILSFLVGVFVGGALTAASTKLFGWFKKQEASVKLP